MDEPSDAVVTELLSVLTARSRAAQATLETFQPPQVGIVEQVGSAWHHFVVGRRGVGKSMLLLTVAKRARESGQPVAYIDVETLRDNPYPDVLIRLLIELTSALEGNLQSLRRKHGIRSAIRRRAAKTSLRELRDRLDTLLREPQEAIHHLSESRGARRGSGTKTRLGVSGEAQRATADLEASLERTKSDESTVGREAQFTRSKIEGLRSEAVDFREALRRAVEASGSTGAVVILDDFYFIPRENQPDVLSYLQQVVKNLNIWIKVGAVEHRLNEFEDGDPPRGLQMTQDAAKVQMDNALADFQHTRRFLEGILKDVCSAAGISVHHVVTETARTRLVVASGGVPRDYLNLVQAALAQATRRDGEPSRPRNKVTAEDVTVAAPAFLRQKEDDLRVDAGPDNVERLRSRLADVLNFCLNLREVSVFMVASRAIREEQWGRDIAALSDLRFFHRIGNPTVKSSDPGYVGQRYEAFALDLSSYAGTRVRTKEIPFWTSDGFQRLRAVSHVYTPDMTRELEAPQRRRSESGKPAPASAPWEQEELFNVFDSTPLDSGSDEDV